MVLCKKGFYQQFVIKPILFHKTTALFLLQT